LLPEARTRFGNCGLLFENRRLPLLPEIAGLYDELRFEAERVVKAKVTSAVACRRRTRDHQGRAEEALRPRCRGRDGGRREPDRRRGDRAGDVVIDGSIRGKLTASKRRFRTENLC
jgi:F-type H+-transporting ATPase subunit delta